MEYRSKSFVIACILTAVIVAGAVVWLTFSYPAQEPALPATADIPPPPVYLDDQDLALSDPDELQPASGPAAPDTSVTDPGDSGGGGGVGNGGTGWSGSGWGGSGWSDSGYSTTGPDWGGTDRGDTGLGNGNSNTVATIDNPGGVGNSNAPSYNFPPNTLPEANCSNAPHLSGCENDPQLLRNLQLSSLSKLAALYKDAPGNIRKAILEEVESREQRVTSVTGEFFPDMEHNKEHNTFITVTRGLVGETSVERSQTAQQLQNETAEPETIDVPNTRTTPEVGIKLSGAGFTIEPEGFVWRTIPDGEEDTFEWTVRPDDENASQLLVSVRNKVVFGDQEISLKVDEFPKTITVTVDIWTRIGRFMAAVGDFAKSTQGLLGLLGVGSIGAIVTWLRRKGKKRPANTNNSAQNAPKRAPPPEGMGGPPSTG